MKKLGRRMFINRAGVLAAGLWFDRHPRPYGETMTQKKEQETYPSYLRLFRDGRLEERSQKFREMYRNCSLCPRDCRVDRTGKERGKCEAGAEARVSSAFPHFGEEAPLVGTEGSGTVFFAHCGLRCVYCQNHEISFGGSGSDVSDRRLAESFIKVQEFGCHNINLVTPTHFLPSIVEAVRLAVPMGLNVPLVYNTGGYEKPDIIQLLDGIVDIYLPDFKYMDPAHAAEYSSEAYNYPHYARLALKEMARQVGVLQMAARRVARRGLMIRHLVLPNNMSDSDRVFQFIADELSPDHYVNVMRQYRPEHRAGEFPRINRQLSPQEYSRALKWAKDAGLR